MKFTTSAKKISAVITAALAAVALAPMTAMAAPTSGTESPTQRSPSTIF
mgnify:CR=1 FL=1